MTDQPQLTEKHVIMIGRYTLRRLARGEDVELSMSNGCRVVLIHASDYPHELADLKPLVWDEEDV